MLMAALGLLGAVLVAVHMAKPRGDRRVISSLHFFDQVPQSVQSMTKLQLANPLFSLPFYVRLALFALILTAFIMRTQTLDQFNQKSMHLWIFVDRSGSMGADYGGRTGMEIIQSTYQGALALVALQGLADVSVGVSLFDLEVALWKTEEQLKTPDGMAQSVLEFAEIQPRALGTQLSLIHEALKNAVDEGKITHVLVLTDQPAPDWLASFEKPLVVWPNPIKQAANTGITRIKPISHPLTGLVTGFELEMTAYGPIAGAVRLRVTNEQGSPLYDEDIAWQDNGRAYAAIPASGPCRLQVELSPGGAYTLDDFAVIDIPQGEKLAVEWRASGNAETWGLTTGPSPQLRVTHGLDDLSQTTPTLVVGSGGFSDTPKRVENFIEGHALLDDLNFDVLEEVAPRGIHTPEGWQPILLDEDGLAWGAIRENPTAAWVPSLPTGRDNRFATTAVLFYNAIRFLIERGPAANLYEQTTVNNPIPEGNRIPLFSDEGNTWRTPRPRYGLAELRPIEGRPTQWPFIWLAAAVCIMVFERIKSASGGLRWR